MRVQDIIELLLLSAVWGASFLFMRTATPEFGAVALVFVRTLVAAAVLLPLLFFARKVLVLRQYWRPVLLVGLVNTALPFCLFSYATAELGAGFASILNATAPMFGALIAFIWLKDNLSPVAITGLVIGFCGVAVISLEGEVSFKATVLPIAAALGATCSYGLAAGYIKRYLTGINPLAIAAGSQFFAALAVAPLALLTWPEQDVSNSAWWQVVVLGVACTGFAYILYFRLIANLGAARAMTVGYLVPVFGVFWGITFLGESLSYIVAFGAALILLGVSLTNGVIRMRKRNVSHNEA